MAGLYPGKPCEPPGLATSSPSISIVGCVWVDGSVINIPFSSNVPKEPSSPAKIVKFSVLYSKPKARLIPSNASSKYLEKSRFVVF